MYASNLLKRPVIFIKWIVDVNIILFVISLNEGLPKRRIDDNWSSTRTKIFGATEAMLLKRVRL